MLGNELGAKIRQSAERNDSLVGLSPLQKSIPHTEKSLFLFRHVRKLLQLLAEK